VASSSFTLKSGVGRKSNDFGSHKSLKIPDKTNFNEVINNSDIANKSERNENGSNESSNGDSGEIYFSDLIYYYDDDEYDDKDGENEEFNNRDDTFGNGDKDTDENGDEDDETVDDDMPDYAYNYTNDRNGIPDQNHTVNKSEAELLRVTRKYVFEPSKINSDDINYKDKNDSENRVASYVYYRVQNLDNDKNDPDDDYKQYGGGVDDGVKKARDAWPSLEQDNGVTAVVDYVVDYVHVLPSSEQYGKSRCLFGWHLDAKGICAPPGNKCKPGLVHNTAGDCVRPDRGYWYK
jgi:hypothetical protein